MSKRLIDGDDYTWPVGSETQPETTAASPEPAKPADPEDGCAAVPYIQITRIDPPPRSPIMASVTIDCRTIDQKLRAEVNDTLEEIKSEISETLQEIDARLARIEAIVSGETVKEMYTK